MLTKRTQILFDQQLWNNLTYIAQEKNISVGQLVRSTLKEKYGNEKKLLKRRQAIKGIFAFRKKYGAKLAKGEDSTLIIRKMREERYGKSHLRRLGSY
jgi:hypothetical protein